jgi:RNAse (barnase) inhibitor barstar
MKTVTIDASAMDGPASLHEAFASALGFPSWYGRNMDAWIDCMSSLDEPGDGLSQVKVQPGEVLVVAVQNAAELKSRFPELWGELLEATAFVNWRRLDVGKPAILTIAADA